MRPAGWLAVLVAVPAWASHPLISEDTGTLGKGKWELERHGERARDRESDVTTHSTEAILKLGRGVAENLDVEVELRYLRESAEDAMVKGAGDASLAAKWRSANQTPSRPSVSAVSTMRNASSKASSCVAPSR